MIKIGGVPAKRLAELRGRLVDAGVAFQCPCGCGIPCYLPFVNPITSEDERPRKFERHRAEWSLMWQRSGCTLDALTLWPGVFRRSSCGWHGYITNGEARTVLSWG